MLDVMDFLLITTGLYWIIEIVWQKVELKKYGKTIPRERDFWIVLGIAIVLALILYNVAWLEVLAVIVSTITIIAIWLWIIFVVIDHSRLKLENKELEKLLEDKSETIKEYSDFTDTLITEIKNINKNQNKL